MLGTRPEGLESACSNDVSFFSLFSVCLLSKNSWQEHVQPLCLLTDRIRASSLLTVFISNGIRTMKSHPSAWYFHFGGCSLVFNSFVESMLDVFFL